LQDLFGKHGCVCRYGGDEFVSAMMGLDLKQAIKISKGLTEKIRQLKLMVRSADGRQEITFSCSVGMLFCESGAKIGNSSQILELADHQMYSVKNEGKNDMHYNVLGADEELNTQKTKPTSKIESKAK
ncbi:MAG: diguanylate cyclase, partial [Planctomycetes bacterium]|nr:diguanylate cyclase [Planctomycetota bacterium]